MLENFKCKSDNSLELIGGTPLVKLNKVVPSNGSNIFVKLESTNPGGSVKDRIALSMVEDAEKNIGAVGRNRFGRVSDLSAADPAPFASCDQRSRPSGRHRGFLG